MFQVRWDMGMFNGSRGNTTWLEFGMASFLIAQGDYCYFGAAANWYDQDWPWYPQYEWKIGRPLVPAVRHSKYRWSRAFEWCTVGVDLVRALGTFSWRASKESSMP